MEISQGLNSFDYSRNFNLIGKQILSLNINHCFDI